MPLTDNQVRNARYSLDGTGNRLSDGERMYLQIDKSGSKYWRMNYRFAGKDKTLALGVYPHVSVAAARKKRDDARQKLTAGPALSLTIKPLCDSGMPLHADGLPDPRPRSGVSQAAPRLPHPPVPSIAACRS